MRRGHFEALRPICPVCRDDGGPSPLRIALAAREEGEHLVEGILRCDNPACLREYPVIDGLPVLIPAIREYAAAHLAAIDHRDDLSAEVESLLGDCLGSESPYDRTRRTTSSYAWDHYGGLDPREPDEEPRPGSAAALLAAALDAAGEVAPGPAIDVGCAVGGTTFALAERTGGLVLGIDLDYGMARLAARVQRHGRVRYPRRRVGLVYDRRDFEVDLAAAERVDFWICDATSLPFDAGTFTLAAALNLIDCVHSPLAALESLAGVLAPAGKALLTTPYDWSPQATPVESWLGGHSQRGEAGGASEPVLRALLRPGGHPAAIEELELVVERDHLPWRVRLHQRSVVEYRVHLLVAEKTGAAAATGPAP